MNKNKAKQNVFSKALRIAVVAVFLAFFIFNPLRFADADNAVDFGAVSPEAAAEDNAAAFGATQAIKTQDAPTKAAVKKGAWQNFKDNLKKFTWDKVLSELKKAGDVAWKAALKNFLNTLAYDMATYLATGDKGQLPMFHTQGWGGYLKNVADNAAGTFIEELGKEGLGGVRFNLCNPDFRVLLRINLGLLQTYRPRKPACTFSELTKNWDTALKDKDFLPKFQDMFNPWSNDLGIALTLQTGITQNITDKTLTATKDREEGQGFKPLTDAISKNIKTPGQLIKQAAGIPLEKAPEGPLAYTGSVVADSIDIFINTLAGKLIERWLRGGLATKFPPLTSKLDSLTNPEAQNLAEGAAGAENRMRSIIEPNFKVRADYDILAELATCPDPNKAGPTDCVIDEKFRQAIEKKLTVGQALKQGYLNGNGVFGFTADGLEPKFNEGYPYRAMIILRKYRIIPAGWEIAAQYIKDKQSVVGGTKNLKNLAECFGGSDEYGTKGLAPSWCAGLVDPDWVLKAPQNFCKREGAGPEIISEQVTGEGAGSSLSVLRDDTYCADEQSCIKEKNDGACELYGYCAAERRKWDFNANSCEPRFNTCQSFGAAATASGQTVSYLENTLDFTSCNLGNAGCKKYARAVGSGGVGIYDSAAKTVAWENSSQAIYLNKRAETCDAASQGCHGLIRITPAGNETYDSIEGDGSAPYVAAAYGRFSSTGSAGSLQAGLIHEKLLPSYLQSACYSEAADGKSYEPKPNAPAVCADFARLCKKDEAGCELYASLATETEIPAKAAPEDYCPAECVGYNTFVQSQTVFDDQREAYFIPQTAKTCGAEATGCDQFTNLDEVKKGGEGIEYYGYLRQCLKKTGNQASCGEFYSWEGSDESGYQLKVESLKINGAEPAVTANDGAFCDETIYNLPPSDPAYNADCRQFYNRAGGVSYHLDSRTMVCADDCHPYRRTALNVDENISSGSCTGVDKHWDAGSSQCVVCKSGGVWSPDNNGCLYMAVPGQGLTCAAQANGCREYVGNTGNNIRKILTDDFSGGVGAWSGVSGVSGSNVTASNEAISLGLDNRGHSIEVANAAERRVGNAVSQGLDYVINLVARAKTGAVSLTAALGNGAATSTFAATPALTTAWQIFEINLTGLNHEASAGEVLRLAASGTFYVDSITLTEITDRFYLIKDSWRTPDSCDEEAPGVPHAGYMLGCEQYRDRAGQTHNLKQFSKLCPESAVGCELMIDTKNSTATTSKTFVNSGTTETVPADDFIYAAYDPAKLCGAEEKGCELLGRSYQYENTALYGDIYLKNNPDKYGQILCGLSAVGCEVFAYENGPAANGEKYFKDPGDMVCEWRRQTGAGASENWFKKKVKRCGSNSGAVCLTDSDCQPNVKCQIETDDKLCPTSADKTLGLGGIGNQVIQPSSDLSGDKWAGLCPAADSGCTEYIDPLSKFNTNIIFNGSFQNLDGVPSTVDGWQSVSGGYSQSVTLEPKTAYRLGRPAEAGALTNAGSLTIGCPGLGLVNSNNGLEPAINSITVGKVANGNSKIFYYQGAAAASCTITASDSTGAVELKKAAIDYQLRANLDSRTCNGLVNAGQGCVLFNERKQTGASLAALTWDADTTANGGSPARGHCNLTGASCSVDADCPAGNICQDKDSNVILKVAPDRVCDQWLACQSYIKDAKGDNVCFDIGLCDAVDENGNCQSFISSFKTNQTVEVLGAAGISNLSGYAKVGIQNSSLKTDYYPFGAVEQTGEIANLSNGGFEFYGSNLYPIGWTWGNQANKSWDANVFSVINNPIAAQTQGIGYAPEGATFLKLGSSYGAVSEPVDVIPGADYVITAYVNTKNLKSGQARINIVGNICQSNPKVCAISGNSCSTNDDCLIIKQDLGNDWNFQMGKFKTRAGDSQIQIKLYAVSTNATALTSSEGNFYFDDIKIRPALNSKDNWHTTQSCRLYPQSDSLSCDYFEDSGKRQKGWSGYCLEYDRRPGDPNTCLLWYPIDKVKGDGLEEGAGYAGKAPVYYCLEATGYCGGQHGLTPKYYCSKVAQTVTSTGQNKFWASRVYQGTDYQVPFATSASNKYIDWGAGSGGRENIILNYARDDQPFGSIVPPYPAVNPYEWDSEVNTNTNTEIQPLNVVHLESEKTGVRAGTPYYGTPANITCAKTENSVDGCTDFTCESSGNAYVTCPAGSVATAFRNKGYGNCNGAGWTYDYTHNTTGVTKTGCYGWEGDCNGGNNGYEGCEVTCSSQPVTYNMAANLNEAKEGVKRLFAQSYGVWNWTGTWENGRYIPATPNQGWGPPGANNEPVPLFGRCSGATRELSSNDYCAILPKIEHVKVNGSETGNVILPNSQFINLSFNTKVDSQQLPLVMYGVDWGDDSKTIVTGVEMRDKPNQDQPETIYHLYGYWDLKGKANSGVTSIDCSTPGQCRVKPKIQIKDNWGWCNGGGAINDCDNDYNWQEFGGEIVVKEK